MRCQVLPCLHVRPRRHRYLNSREAALHGLLLAGG
jgi:hypothetical protein